MKNTALELLPNGKNTVFSTIKKVFLPILTVALLFSVSFFLNDFSKSLLYTEKGNSKNSIPSKNEDQNAVSETEVRRTDGNTSRSELAVKKRCDIFNGSWVEYSGGPYYTNETKCVIDDRQNCLKFGREETEFLKWRWKPDECELPLFDARQFLEVVRGKTMAFVGDSVARNQMQSLVCLLASAAYPIDVSYVPDTRFRRWHYSDYNFTIQIFWAPYLIKAVDSDPRGFSSNSLMTLHLDEPDESWATKIEHSDIVIISAGQWFLRPFYYHEKGRIIGCVWCNDKNTTELSRYYGYRMAFRTTFRTLMTLENFKGVVFLRTFSPDHFENGDWDKGGNCIRTRPFNREEKKLDGFNLEFYKNQVEEFTNAESEGFGYGVKFRLLDTSGAMILRPDGHPNAFGNWVHQNRTINDCVHWCMPGPVDTWNEFLLEMLKREGEGLLSNYSILEKNE